MAGRGAGTAAEAQAFALQVDHAQAVLLRRHGRRSPRPASARGQMRWQMAWGRLQVVRLARVFANDLVEPVFAAALEQRVAELDGAFRVENFLEAVRVELPAHGPKVAVLEVHRQNLGFNALFGSEVNGLPVLGPVHEAGVERRVVEDVVPVERRSGIGEGCR